MKKRAFQILLSICLALSSVLTLPSMAFATDYAQSLRNKGFPESYVTKLVSLHNKYPKWNFEILKTNVAFQTAVNGERSAHSKQLIEKSSSLSSSYYCSCSKCKHNDSYVIQEGSNWVSASENAVKHYMDPRNWLTDTNIFQFESTSYSSSQTKSGVETILKGTWMHDARIHYYTTDGTSQKYYDSSTKYSDAIMTAAKSSGMSAYYLASKIVQEVGSTTANTGGAAGTRAPFLGIYNYYNIGAYNGAMAGLEWAAGYLKLNKATTMYSSYSSGKVSGTKKSLPNGQYMVWRATAGNYYKVRLYSYSNGSYKSGETGYVAKSACRTTYFNHGRPWSNPYKSIVYGAQYIANSFSKTQNTGYLQKFNVAPNTSEKYSHEYMANVSAAVSESKTTYNAYKSANILTSSKTFLIPVYNSMPSSPCSVTTSGSSSSSSTTTSSNKVSGLTLTDRTTTSLTYKWNKISGASKYYIYIKNVTKGSTFSKTVTSTSASLNNLTEANEYAVKVKAYKNSKWTEYSSYNTKHTLPGKVGGVKISDKTASTISIKWNKMSGANGYYVYSYNKSTKKYTRLSTLKGSSATSAKLTGLKAGTTYYLSVSAYTSDTSTKTGSKSSLLTASTRPAKVKITSLSSPKSRALTVKWNKVSGASGYRIDFSTKKDYSSGTTTVYTSSSVFAYTKTLPKAKTTYYVRVRAYKNFSGSKLYSYSSVPINKKTK